MMPKVYVVQQQLHKNDLGILVPKFDLSPAARYGEIVFVLKTDDSATSANVLQKLHDGLQWITEDDYILPIGNTIMMCMASVVAAEYTGKLNFLYWNRNAREYWVETFRLDQ